VHSRAVDLLSRYRGKFQHYDVNNEMLHGCFYRDRLNPEILPYMYKLAHQFDPEAILFVNDYHVEDGVDGNSAPDKYVEHIEWLLKEGAPVGAIGVQGHIDTPVGPIIRNSLDKLSSVGMPIWMTEIDVAATNEHTRADDLEVTYCSQPYCTVSRVIQFWY
jgi:GH35 family endo-1,4-beta-xylanase